MNEFSRSIDESAVNGERRVGRPGLLTVRRADVLFSTVVYCENPHRPCGVVFTRTHFAWKPLRAIFFFPFARTGIYAAVEWSAVNLVEFEYRGGDHEKLIRVTWMTNSEDTNSLEMSRIVQFHGWFRPFRAVGFSPPKDNPLRVTTVRGFLCDYGPMAWVLLLAICSFAIFQFGPRLLTIIPTIVHLLGLPLWIWAMRKARQWFPPGTRVVLHREQGWHGANPRVAPRSLAK